MKQLLFLLAFSPLLSWAQDFPNRTVNLDAVTLLGKKTRFKKVGLYDESFADRPNIKGFSQLEIFTDAVSDEVWTVKNATCIGIQPETDEKDAFLKLNWNKDQDGCDWVGMGFGWDMWSAKDMAYIKDTIAIELEVRSTGKSFTNLPWAFGIEDYANRQAWLGYNTAFLMAKEITNEWTKVQIPFSLFPFDENELDLTSVKQLIIQFFSEGKVEINSIKIVPFTGKLRQETTASTSKISPKLDGDLSDWKAPFTEFETGHSFAVHYSNDSLFVAVKVDDPSPGVNEQTGSNLWNGDAIEIAFSTNTNADPKRKFFLLSDQHIGINCGANPYAWDWKESVELKAINFKIQNNATGYTAEIAIPYKQLYKTTLKSGDKIGFEIAVDLNITEQKRQRQDRWNSKNVEGFHLSPGKWGEVEVGF